MQTIPQSKLRAVIWIDHEMALIVITKDNRFVKKEVLHSNLDQQLHEETHHEHPLHKDAHWLYNTFARPWVKMFTKVRCSVFKSAVMIEL